MARAPQFLDGDHPTSWPKDETFSGARATRRSEALAWLVAVGFGLLAAAGQWRGDGPAPLSAELAALFGVIGLWITFGNWIDRRTAIEVTEAGVRFRSPLREVAFSWRDVDELWAVPSGSSWRIVVRGQGGHFGFRTSSELRVASRSVQFGFPDGERLADLIRSRSGLGRPMGSNGAWVCTRQRAVSEEREARG